MSLINIKSRYAYLQHLADSGLYRNNSSRDEHSKTHNSNKSFFLHAVFNYLHSLIFLSNTIEPSDANTNIQQVINEKVPSELMVMTSPLSLKQSLNCYL